MKYFPAHIQQIDDQIHYGSFFARCIAELSNRFIPRFKGLLRSNSAILFQRFCLRKNIYKRSVFLLNGDKYFISWPASIPYNFDEILSPLNFNETYEFFKQVNITRDSIVFDVGANIGTKSLAYSLWLNKSGRVYAFEPFRPTFKFLQKNMVQNNFENIKCFSFGFSSDSSNQYMGMPDRTQDARYAYKNGLLEGGLFSIYAIKESEVHEKRMICNFTTMDNFVQEMNIKRIDFIKIDTEGHELHVLKGSKKTLNKFHPILQIEITSFTMKISDTDPVEILEFLSKIEYVFYQFEDRRLIALTSNQIIEMCKSDYHLELYCIHSKGRYWI